MNHWIGLPQRVSALDFFAAMVKDGTGLLSRESFLEFWRTVKEEGISDDEIAVQLELTELKEMWIGLDSVALTESSASRGSQRPKPRISIASKLAD